MLLSLVKFSFIQAIDDLKIKLDSEKQKSRNFKEGKTANIKKNKKIKMRFLRCTH